MHKDLEALVALFAPYCEGNHQPLVLEKALTTLNGKRLDGARRLKPDGSHGFELSWEPGESPQEPSSCQLNFPDFPSVSYRFSVPTAQLVIWLMRSLEARANPDSQTLPMGAQAAPSMPTVPIPAPPLPGAGIAAMPPPPLPLAPPIQFNAPAPQPPGPRVGPVDLPESFWRWLLVGDLPTDPGA